VYSAGRNHGGVKSIEGIVMTPTRVELDFVAVTRKGHKNLVADRIRILVLEKVFVIRLLHALTAGTATGFLSNREGQKDLVG